jgi:hypothetical protein
MKLKIVGNQKNGECWIEDENGNVIIDRTLNLTTTEHVKLLEMIVRENNKQQ